MTGDRRQSPPIIDILFMRKLDKYNIIGNFIALLTLVSTVTIALLRIKYGLLRQHSIDNRLLHNFLGIIFIFGLIIPPVILIIGLFKKNKNLKYINYLIPFVINILIYFLSITSLLYATDLLQSWKIYLNLIFYFIIYGIALLIWKVRYKK